MLIVGGSQGARAVNDAMLAAAPALAPHAATLVVTHQSGERNLARVRDGYAAAAARPPSSRSSTTCTRGCSPPTSSCRGPARRRWPS